MLENLPKKIKIVEVGPRDGLQNEEKLFATEDKILFVEKLVDAGLKNIEITSFVRPQSIPQMQDASALFTSITKKYQGRDDLHFPCLVPNVNGMEKALAVGVNEIVVFSSTSDTFNQKNINTDVVGSFKRINQLVKTAQQHKMKIRAYVSTAFGCPYEGGISTARLSDLVQRFADLGANEISLGDTIGVGTPRQVKDILEKLTKTVDLKKIAMHFHDTRGMALANTLVSLDMGIEIFDSSAGGLGGCPYAKGAAGNLATEDLYYLLDSLGINLEIDLDKLIHAARFMLGKLHRKSTSKFSNTHKI